MLPNPARPGAKKTSAMRLLATLLLLVLCSQVQSDDLERGYQAFERGDVAAAVEIWRGLAEQGDTTAQLNLGQLYRQGKGVAVDDAEAAKWYSLAAKQGSDVAKYNLLMMEKDGRASREQLSPVFTEAPSATAQETPAQTPEGIQDDWLGQLPTEQFLLQLGASSNEESVKQFRDKHLQGRQPPVRIARTENNNKSWHVLLWGPFPSREAAKAALQELPDAVKKGKPWIRTVASVQQSQ